MWRAVVTQPLDRNCTLPALGELDRETGEFWLENVFSMPRERKNLSAFERNRSYLNIDGQSFIDVSYASGCDIDSDSRSVITGDFNADGAPDLLIGSVGGGPVRLFLNQLEPPASTRITLRGTSSNRPAIGARVVIRCGDRNVVRDVFATNGCLGQSPARLLVGLGNAEQIDELKVRWPNGDQQVFAALPVNQPILLVEGESSPTVGVTSREAQ